MLKVNVVGGGSIKISRINLESQEYVTNILENMPRKLSQNVANIYLQNLLEYNIIDKSQAKLIQVAISDKSLTNVDIINKDLVRSDIFKSLIINAI